MVKRMRSPRRECHSKPYAAHIGGIDGIDGIDA
jgi:hypothetical protein